MMAVMSGVCSRVVSGVCGIGGFSPLSLAPYGFWDAAIPGTLWKDTAGTIPATADGDQVALIKDAYGRSAFDLLQTNAAKRALLRISGGLKWLQFDGLDDSYATAGNVTLPVENVVMAATDLVAVSGKILMEHSTNADAVPGFRINQSVSKTHIATNGTSAGREASSSTWGGGLAVLGWSYNAAGVFGLEKDGVAVAMAAATGTPPTGNATAGLFFGARNNSLAFISGNVYAVGIFPAIVGFDSRLRTYFAADQGRVL